MVSANSFKTFHFCKEFSDAQLEKLAALAVEETCEAGVQMYKKGDPALKFYLVQEGKIILVMDSALGPHKPPLQVTVDIITAGDAMGWSAIVEPHVYTLGALCIDNTKLIALDAAKLRSLLEGDGAFGFKFMQAAAKLIASRLTHTRIILVGERGLSTLTEY